MGMTVNVFQDRSLTNHGCFVQVESEWVPAIVWTSKRRSSANGRHMKENRIRSHGRGRTCNGVSRYY